MISHFLYMKREKKPVECVFHYSENETNIHGPIKIIQNLIIN